MAGKDPFATLLEIAERCRGQSRGLPEQEVVQDIWSGVGFMLGGKLYATPLGEVSETLKLPRTTRLPRARNWVIGVCNIRGRLVPILDLGRFLLRHSSLAASRCRVMIIEEEELTRGLLVDAVLGMQRLPADGFSRTVEDVPETIFPFVRGSYRKGDERWTVFSLRALLTDPSFSEVALDTPVAM